MSLNLKSSGGGSVTVDVPSTASNYTATLPAANGTVQVSGNQPAFSAYQSTQQTGVASNTFTKVNLQTVVFDTNSSFASSRFTPSVAGYYQLNAGLGASAGAGLLASIYKNGVEYSRGTQGTANQAVVSSLVYLNGSTDYVELYVWQNSGSATSLFAFSAQTYFNGALVRAA